MASLRKSKRHFQKQTIPSILKRQVYDQCIIPMITYGAETLKLRTMQCAHERIMPNITWRDHEIAKWIRQQTKVRDILETISKVKWMWTGHLMRRNDNGWTTKLTTWQPRGYTRNRGRQKTRWRDDLDKFKKFWHQYACDRRVWRELGKAYIQQRTYQG